MFIGSLHVLGIPGIILLYLLIIRLLRLHFCNYIKIYNNNIEYIINTVN